MGHIKVIAQDGMTRDVTAEIGLSLLEILHKAGYPLKATCGGSLACATCHVIIHPEDFDRIGARSEDEEDMLDQAFHVTRTSRLGCQITYASELEGLRVMIPEGQ